MNLSNLFQRNKSKQAATAADKANQRSHKTSKRARKNKPQVERLEGREMMTAMSLYGNLYISGDQDSDSIRIYDSGSYVKVVEDGEVSWHHSPTNIFVFGNGGNDSIVNYSSRGAHIWGGDGDDAIWGGDGNDVIYGGNGNDRISAGWGNDTLYGEAGDDFLSGGSGNDALFGGEGHDRIFGGWGDDKLYGGTGNDVLDGGSNDDELFGGWGNDKLYGSNGADTLRGEAGHDELFGGWGDDKLYGGAGSDVLRGDEGEDGLFGGGQFNVDYLYGGAGADRFLVNTWRDIRLDATAEDASIEFTNRASGSVSLTGLGSVQFAAGAWTDAEIEKVDVALENLHHHVSGTTLLKTAAGGGITFQRVGTQQSGTDRGTVLGWNAGSSTIAFTDASFSKDLELWQTVYHEIAHNWDDPSENWSIPAFRSLSGWTSTQPRVVINAWYTFGQDVDVTSYYYSAAGDGNGNWWHSKSAEFARGYGKWNPLEDYATTWETYFAEKYHGTTDGNTRVASKYAMVDAFFNSLG